MKNNLLYLECTCSSPDHLLKIIRDPASKAVYIETQLVQHNNFLKRLLVAIKYIFNKTSKYSYWEETILNVENTDKLIRFLKDFKNSVINLYDDEKIDIIQKDIKDLFNDPLVKKKRKAPK